MKNVLKNWVENDKREVNRMGKIADNVLSFEDEYSKMSDEELQGNTAKFKTRLENGENLDDILPEAFATVREGAKRVLGLLPFKVQIIGGIAIHEGNIAEMKTGEGKTLTATMPVYLNALSGNGVHVVTVNEYLSARDAEEMGELYTWLGLSVGLNSGDKSQDEKREAYNADITYSTNSELGFDYLRDNMVLYKEQMVQRPLNFAVIDEVDSILIDEARTPLIISGQSEKSTDLYRAADNFVKSLTDEEDYKIDWPTKTIGLTEAGIKKADKAFNVENIYDTDHTALTHHIDESLRANYTMLKDKDYVVQNDEVLIVDQFTGRVMDGRRYSDGLHQAIEAKEGVTIQEETKTMANITYQNYFRMYAKLSGMTGTAKTEEEEFREIYNMEVISIPTNRELIREDMDDELYPTLEAKFHAIVKDISERHAKGQPVLVGTVAVESSELLSNLLTQKGIPHAVLNAKNHAKEAEIIKNAGQKGAVTIATNMAGRGTDIKLGQGVLELGGLAVIGTERHESRRIDNQLRGRAGRQGDPGYTKFYMSLEDDLMRRFGSEKVQRMLQALVGDSYGEDTVIRSRYMTRAVESAQKRVEGNNYDTRKNTLQYDDVLRQQREVMYNERLNVIQREDSLKDVILPMMYQTVKNAVDLYTDDANPEKWNLDGIVEFVQNNLSNEDNFSINDLVGKTAEEIRLMLNGIVDKNYEEKSEQLSDSTQLLEFEKVVILRVVDENWTNHIDEMDQLRQSIGLRGYGQLNPLVEYQEEGFRMFNEMIGNIDLGVTRLFNKAEIRQNIRR